MLKNDLKNNLSFWLMESIINFKDINPKKISIEYKKNKFKIEYMTNQFYFNTPSLYIPYGINNNYKTHYIDVCINDDNNETQNFRSKILAIENMIQEEYNLKKKVNLGSNNKKIFISNIKKNKENLRLKIKQSSQDNYICDVYHDSNEKKKNFNYKFLNQSFCAFLINIGDIWEYENNWGYNLYIHHIYIYIIKELIDYSFLSDDENDNYSLNSNDTDINDQESHFNNTNIETCNKIIDNKTSLEIYSSNIDIILINNDKKNTKKNKLK